MLQLAEYVVAPIFAGEWSDNTLVLRMKAYGFAFTVAGVPVEVPAQRTDLVPVVGRALTP